MFDLFFVDVLVWLLRDFFVVVLRAVPEKKNTRVFKGTFFTPTTHEILFLLAAFPSGPALTDFTMIYTYLCLVLKCELALIKHLKN